MRTILVLSAKRDEFNDELLKSASLDAWKCLDLEAIRVIQHDNLAGLQLADIAVSALFAALNPNYYHNTELSYFEILFPRLYRGFQGKPHLALGADFKELNTIFPKIKTNNDKLIKILTT